MNAFSFSHAVPHGGTLVRQALEGRELEQWREKAPGLPRITLNARELSDVEMIGIGAFSPLQGFMGQKDYASVVERMRLANGLVWSIPVTLSVTAEKAKELKEGTDLALANDQGTVVALFHLKEKYTYDKANEAQHVYKTTEDKHPGVAALYRQGEILLGGEVKLLGRTKAQEFLDYRLDPAETRQIFEQRGWRTVVGFQTRNPVHRAHEYLQKCALEMVDGFLLHPIVGETKGDDIPARVRMQCYEVLLANYYPKNRVLLAVNPAAMRYAGPREAIFHALIRKNYGCTHFIVGRDHAGVGNYYGTFDAQKMFSEFKPEELGITPLMFDNSFFCKRCGHMASEKTCPHTPDDRVSLSGTRVREMLAKGELPPVEFTRPEIAKVLIEAMKTAVA